MSRLNDQIVEITPEVLLNAYACGSVPIAESADDPGLYWIEPERRGIIPLDNFRISSRLARTVRSDKFEVRIDTDFEGVIAGCAEPQEGRDKTWINWTLWEAENGKCSNTSYKTKSACESKGKVWTPASHDTWNGCVTDRDQNYDTTNDAALAGGTRYPAEQYNSCPVAAMPLSNDWTTLSAKIDAMQPAGNTNQAIGLQMGWQTLTAEPFTVPAFDMNYQYNQVIILLTDGLNTENRWSTSQSAVDKRQQKTCDNIKAAGITLYTVQVNTGSDPTSALLQNCASTSSKFFLLTSGSQIITTFNQIGTALSQLRLSQ